MICDRARGDCECRLHGLSTYACHAKAEPEYRAKLCEHRHWSCPLGWCSGGHRRSPVRFGRQTFTRTGDPTMTDEMMSLRTLLEKSSEADLLREMVGFAAQRNR